MHGHIHTQPYISTEVETVHYKIGSSLHYVSKHRTHTPSLTPSSFEPFCSQESS